MSTQYNHLSTEERVTIMVMLFQRQTLRAIASLLGPACETSTGPKRSCYYDETIKEDSPCPIQTLSLRCYSTNENQLALEAAIMELPLWV